MEKHVYFWLGVFVSILVAVPLSIGVIFVLGTEAIDIAAFLIGALFSLITCLLIVIMFRDKILRNTFNTTKASLADAADSLAAVISSATKGDVVEVRQHSQAFSQILLSWYVWTGFYKWVIATGVALLGTFAVFAGTILIIDQNDQLREANKQSVIHSRNAQTIQVLAATDTNQELRRDFESLGKDMRAHFGEKLPESELIQSTKSVLNYYETVAAAANEEALNKELILRNSAEGMGRIFRYVDGNGYLRRVRCVSKSKDTRKRFEQFEIFVKCHIPVYYRQPAGAEPISLCVKNIQANLLSDDYCKTR